MEVIEEKDYVYFTWIGQGMRVFLRKSSKIDQAWLFYLRHWAILK